MILEMAIADALAIPFEFVDDPEVYGLRNDLTYQQHPKFTTLVPSCYTDDTLRTIATAKVLISDATPHFAGARAYNPVEYVAAIMREYQNDQRYGWSNRFQQYLEDNQYRSPHSFMLGMTAKPTNGALMGCLPCGYLFTPRAVNLAAAAQAIATHNSATIPYAQMMAMAVYFYRRARLDMQSHEDMVAFVLDHIDDPTMPKIRLQDCAGTVPTSSAADTAIAVFDLLGEQENNSLSDIVRAAIKRGGDTDTSAALTVGIASQCPGLYTNDFTPEMISKLDLGRSNNRFAQVSYDLETLFPRPDAYDAA